MVHTVTNSRAM